MTNIVMIVPTGIGAEIGGHAGDSTPASKLLASVCDNLITHPNVVNGSDLNEMAENTLYVEGSQLDQFLEGNIVLEKVKSNRILVAVNPPVKNEIINSVNAARVNLGADIKILELNEPLRMIATKDENGRASGKVHGWQGLVNQVTELPFFRTFDALAINTSIECDKEVAMEYMQGSGGVNPWGGVEAMASRLIAQELDIPVAHAPNGHVISATFDEIVDSRMSAEMVSCCYLHCVLKGLHKAPRLVKASTLNRSVLMSDFIGSGDIDFLVSPAECWGKPHILCREKNIPIIVVKTNTTILNSLMECECIYVENYLEAVGVIQASKIGITRQSVTRPMYQVKIYRKNEIKKIIQTNLLRRVVMARDMKTRLVKIFVEHLGVDESKVTPLADMLDDLGADSLDQVEILMAVEEEFDLKISDETAESWKTVEDIENYLTSQGVK